MAKNKIKNSSKVITKPIKTREFVVLFYNNTKQLLLMNFNWIRWEKFIFYSIVGFIFLLAFLMRFSLNNLPFSGPDSIGYLGVALNYLDTNSFSPTGRTYPYPLFLTIILSSFKSLSAITAIQHFFGMLAGIIMLRIFFMIEFLFLKLSKIQKYFYWLSAILALYILMCSHWSVYIEHHSHPESLTSFLIILLIFTYLKFSQIAINKSSFNLVLTYSVICCFLNYFIFKFQPRYGLNLVLVFILFYLILTQNFNKKKATIAIFTALYFILMLLVLPFHHLKSRNYAMPPALFFHNLKTISLVIKSDLEDKKIDTKKKILLESILVDLKKAEDPNNDFATGYSKSLGLNTDYLGFTFIRIYQYTGSFEAANEFYSSYLKRTIKEYPSLMILKIVKEFFALYSSNLTFKGWNINSLWNYSYQSTISFKDFFPNNKIAKDYNDSLQILSDNSAENIVFTDFYSNIESILITAKTVLPYVIVIFLILFIVSYKQKNEYYKFGIFIFTLLMLHFGFNATISIANTTAVIRYLYDQMAIIILFEFFAIIFIAFSLGKICCKFGMANLKNRLYQI